MRQVRVHQAGEDGGVAGPFLARARGDVGTLLTEDAADGVHPHLSLAYGLTRANDREDVRKEAEMMVANENFDGEEMEFETISLWETTTWELPTRRRAELAKA